MLSVTIIFSSAAKDFEKHLKLKMNSFGDRLRSDIQINRSDLLEKDKRLTDQED